MTQHTIDEALKALEKCVEAHERFYYGKDGGGRQALQTLRDQKQPPQPLIQPTDNYSGEGTYEARYPAPPQIVAGDSFFDGKDYSAALGKIEYLLNQERQHLSFMTEENQPDYFLDPIKQDIASYEAAIELIKQAALTRHEGA
jgi:hypothetical protein